MYLSRSFEDVVAIERCGRLLLVEVAVEGADCGCQTQPFAALFGCRGEVEQQFGEFFEVRVAESVFVDEGGDEIRSGQQRVDVQIQLLGQLRFGGFPDEFGGARLLRRPILSRRAAISSPMRLISRKI